MAKSVFEKRLDKVLGTVFEQKPQTPYEQAKEKLRLVCDRIEELLAGTSKKVLLSLQPGYKANIGQQINVVVEVPQRQYRDTLFRAYIPDIGQPISLDFYGEQPVSAGTPSEMEEAILAFLTEEQTQERLKAYRDLALK